MGKFASAQSSVDVKPDVALPPRPQPTRRHWVLGAVILPLLVTRFGLALVGWFAMHFLPHIEGVQPHWELSPRGKIVAIVHGISADSRPLTNMWSRWDAGWYHAVAKNGYSFTPGSPSNTAFYPLYPLLMRATHLLIASKSDAGWFVAGIIVSNLALCAAMIYLFLLTRLEFDEATARRAVLYMLLFPTTLFLSAVYSESVFLVFAIGSFYCARRRQWWVAGVLAAAAALSRPPGFIVLAALVVEYAVQCEFRWKSIRVDAIALFLVPIALAGHVVFLRIAQGNGAAAVHAQQAWGLKFEPLWQTFGDYLRGPLALHGAASRTIVDLLFTTAFFTLLPAIALRLRPSYAAYAAAYLAFCTAWGSFSSMPRYVLGVIPAFILLAHFGRRLTFSCVYLALAAASAGIFMAIFALWGWVA